ncbi:uncharacterized protein LOC111325079 [Stylophora pistillata]|uniref:uncharacterized protein LOC111325079 n=1 Tax=Stylophora pistillata TaxID=50429 RepID=UPI000C04FE7E|nr:uncharacterized protein LOC111325079 [Stylophora pistillata]
MASFVNYIYDNEFGILAITEAGFSDKNAAVKAQCTHDGYKLYDVHRSGRNGGGTALITGSNITVKQVVTPTWCYFGLYEWIVINGSSRLRLAIVYRPPYSTKYPVTIFSFVSEFSQHLESFVLCTEPILLCGDFNIYVDFQDNPNAELFLDLIDSFGLAQHVHFATHVQGHTLGLVITRKMDSIIQDAPISGSFLSDHATVSFNLKCFKSESSAKVMWFRKTKFANLLKFKNDLRNSEFLLNTPKHLAGLVNCFNTTLKSIIDKHASWRKRTMIQRAQAPWLSDEIRSVKRDRRIAERNWRSTKSASDRRTFKLLRNKAFFLMNKSRCEFYTDLLGNLSDDQRKLFAATKKLLNQPAETPFPPHGDKLALANDMGSFFVNKILDLRVNLDATENSYSSITHHSSRCASSFTAFRRVDMDYLRKLVLKAPTKSCVLDPVPTNIMKDCLDELLPILSTMINLSLESGASPDIWKDSVVFTTPKQNKVLTWLLKIVESHLPNPHCYADDTQLYIAFRPGNDMEEIAALTAMESCITDISQWMHLADKFKLNVDNTECFLIGPRQELQKSTIRPPEFTYHETPTDTECHCSVGHWITKILPRYTIAFPSSLASD